VKVVSYQCSGVAWQPYRVQRCLAGSSVVEYRRTASHAGLESYALPEVDAVLPNVLDVCDGADILHLHHAYASGETIAVVRAAFPALKIVVTVHGEPDRSMVRQPCEPAPDAYHVVEPGLCAFLTNAPVTFIPNHPAIDPSRPIHHERNRGPIPQFLIPYSHVAQWKDHDAAQEFAERLHREGWTILRLAKRVDHATMLGHIAGSDAVWVQMQGYFDLLTMECWTLGALPIVKRPESIAEWSEHLGFTPELPSVLRDPRWRDSLTANATGMRERWTMTRARSAWESFYQGVLSK
jgi:hypothetical protein